MKKIFKKFWGVALVVMLLSTFIVIPAAPAAAANYAFTVDATALPVVSTGLGIIDVAQCGDVIYGIGLNAGVNALYKSADGGATWSAVGLGAALPAGGNWALVAVAQDDPSVVAVVDKTAVPSVVYVSVNGGISFAAITALAAGTVVNAIDISSPDLVTGWRSIAVGGYNVVPAEGSGGGYLATWQIGNFAAAWNVPVDTAPANAPVTDNILAVAWSPDYQNDQALLYVGVVIAAGVANGNVSLHVYSWLYVDYDADVDASYPRILSNTVAPAALTCARVTIALDDLFSLLGYEMGFIGAEIMNTGVESGNVWRINTLSAALTPLGPAAPAAIPINSVAWDGTNLMAAPYQVAAGPITIYRSAVAATTTGLTGSSAYKNPGTGTLPLVFFAGGMGYCVSQGNNAAVAMTADLGKTFNGIALYNTNLLNVIDFWISSDASVMYVLTDDGVDINLWQKAGGVYQRIAILVAKTGEAWLVRSANSDTNAIYLAKKGAKNMLKSIDGGVTWVPKNSTQNVADYAVQSATLVYVASSTGPTVIKTSGASWATVGALGGGVGYNLTLLPDGTFVVGGSTGFVGYYDGTAWATVALAWGAGPTVVTASGTATGDVIYAGSAAGVAGVGSWTIGVSAAWLPLTAAIPITGIAYANGVTYAYDDAADNLYRYLDGLAADVIAGVGTEIFNQVNMVNALQITTGSNTLWARDAVAAAADTIQSYTEFLLAALPVCAYPINAEIIPVNSLNGITNPFNFTWTAPAVTALPVGTTYTISVFFDAAGLLPVGAVAGVAGTNYFSATPAGPFVGAFTAGETYYWNIQITAPIKSLPSAMQSFTVQQLSAVVPVISAPVNGSTVETLQPGFSWEPISGATMYEFQLSKGATFTVLAYTDNVSSAGASLPVAMKLEDGQQYYWRVRVIAPAVGEWSQVGIFAIAIPVTPTPTPPVTPTFTVPMPSITVTAPQPTVTVIVPTPTTETKEISPAYIWAIIIIGAVLVIAVIVLIVRTRRSV
jgi:hypothetical protein